MMWIFQDLITFQREIYLAFADRIKAFAETGEWSLLAAYLPMGILFGIAHALTPGHSKIVLATYLAGTTSNVPRGLAVALVLSGVHVGISVLIALLSLPLVSVALGSVGRAPMLEMASRATLGIVGLWMLWNAVVQQGHDHRHGPMAGFFAGLIPCPLTLFVMTFAISRGVPEAGVAFAVVMMCGVAVVLCMVALVAMVFRAGILRLSSGILRHTINAGRTIQILASLILIVVAFNSFAS